MTDVRPHIPLLPLGLATWFGAGLMPKAPGTWGSLAALPFAWLILHYGGYWWLAGAAVLVFLVGWWASNVYIAGTSATDPGAVVIDEVAGQWLTLLPATTLVWWHWAVGFALFRFFDIVKPWPVGWADRRVKGGFGVMIDDVIAGVYAGALLCGLILIKESKYIF
ncbi:MAG TPA: phosphatidylglycerophosphatase A [Alphaproteobacteria bacterium]|nr:phosphatidylglycerophosphatase A [Alphaproteobacteria bacterium]